MPSSSDGEPGLVAESLGGDLVGGDAGAEVGAGGLAGLAPVRNADEARAWSPAPSPLGRALSQVRPLSTIMSFLHAAPAAAGSAASS